MGKLIWDIHWTVSLGLWNLFCQCLVHFTSFSYRSLVLSVVLSDVLLVSWALNDLLLKKVSYKVNFLSEMWCFVVMQNRELRKMETHYSNFSRLLQHTLLPFELSFFKYKIFDLLEVRLWICCQDVVFRPLNILFAFDIALVGLQLYYCSMIVSVLI